MNERTCSKRGRKKEKKLFRRVFQDDAHSIVITATSIKIICWLLQCEEHRRVRKYVLYLCQRHKGCFSTRSIQPYHQPADNLSHHTLCRQHRSSRAGCHADLFTSNRRMEKIVQNFQRYRNALHHHHNQKKSILYH